MYVFTEYSAATFLAAYEVQTLIIAPDLFFSVTEMSSLLANMILLCEQQQISSLFS